MKTEWPQETMVERTVTYALEIEGKFFLVENVPARVCLETGESFFSPDVVERLQKIVWEGGKPKRTIETPVYEFI